MATNITKELDFKSKLMAESGYTPQDKSDIKDLLIEAIKIYGSARAVANRCGISDGAVSLVLSGKYNTIGDNMFTKIATGIGWRKKTWNIADTRNYRAISTALTDAKMHNMFLAIAADAGSGKTSTLDRFIYEDITANTFVLKCWPTWGPKEFLIHLRIVLGAPLVKGTVTTTDMLEQIIKKIHDRKGHPLLIVDQANSCIEKIVKYFLPIYNETEGKLGVVLSGTGNLEKELKTGVHYDKKGYDEMHSRLGRSIIHLPGNNFSDVKKICIANGIKDKDLQETIFNECQPQFKTERVNEKENASVRIVDDGRLIKRKILKYLLMANANETPAQIKQAV